MQNLSRVFLVSGAVVCSGVAAVRAANDGAAAKSKVQPEAAPVALQTSDPMGNLAGRWTGNAVMTTPSGSASNFKCIVTYIPRRDGPGMQQNLRCENETDFKLQAATELLVEGGRVTGRWQDKINDIEGAVAGKMTPAGFEVDLTGQFFAARMAVSGSGCDQSVKVTSQKSEMFRELAAALKRC